MNIFDNLKSKIKENREIRLSGRDICIPWINFPRLSKAVPGVQQGRYYIITSGPKAGKCLGKGTKVLMYDGTLKNVEEVIVGDLLMGDDSTPRRVLTTTKGIDELYKIKQSKGKDYVVNSAHILTLFNRQKGILEDIPLSNLNSKKLKHIYRGYKCRIEFQKQNLFNPYLFGLWLGDGDSSICGITNYDSEIQEYLISVESDYLKLNILPINRYYFSSKRKLSSYDEEGNLIKSYRNIKEATLDCNITHSEYISRATKSNKKVGGYFWKWDIKNNIFHEFLKNYKLYNNKHIPDIYLKSSVEQRLELLAGIIDSDGYLGKKNYYEIITKYDILSENIKYLANSLGFNCKIFNKEATMKRLDGSEYRSHVKRIIINGEKIHEIPVKIKRKKAKEYTTKTRNSNIKIESLGIGEYYGFEIDGNKRFLLEDFTVTHNTQIADTLFVLEPMEYLLNRETDIEIEIYYFSMEMSKNDKVAQLVSNKIFFDTKKIISPENLLSLYENYIVEDEIVDLIDSAHYKELFDFYSQHIHYIDNIRSPHEIFQYMFGVAKKNGKFFKNGKEINLTEAKYNRHQFNEYVPNNPRKFIIVVADHVGLLSSGRETLEESIQNYSANYCIAMRDIFNFTVVNIQQQALEAEKQQFTFKGDSIIEKLKPSFSTLGDNRKTSRDMDVIFGLFAPHKHNIEEYPEEGGYDITKFKDNIRELIILLNRRGRSNLNLFLYFNGAVNYFEELPDPDKFQQNQRLYYNYVIN